MGTSTTLDRQPTRPGLRQFLPLVQGATLIEWTGTGLFLAVSTIYFVKVAHLSTSSVGAGLTIGGAVAVATAVPIARLAARFGPKPVLIGVMLLRALATVGYLGVDGWWSFLLVVAVIAVTEQSSPRWSSRTSGHAPRGACAPRSWPSSAPSSTSASAWAA